MTKWKCPTDLAATQWQILEPIIRKKSNRGRKVVYPRRHVINTILYLVRTGCQWRMLPDRFSPWKTVCQIIYRWRLDGTWERLHDRLREMVGRKRQKKTNPMAAIIDSQCVKTIFVTRHTVEKDFRNL